jgi:DNA-binding XRE family transcriptional regulator
MESGDYARSVYLAHKVAKALDTSVERLWGGETWKGAPHTVGAPWQS